MEGDSELIHPGCRKRFKLINEPRCFRCGRHIPEEEIDICSECREKNHVYDYGFPLFEYNETARTAMIDFKKNGHRSNGEFFAEEFINNLGERLLSFRPQVLIPVPSERSKQGERGFNQSEFIALIIGEKLGIPVDTEVLIRNKSKEQKELTKEERAENALRSFECIKEIGYKRVCIVDDVYTTGSTIDGCARILKDAGASEVGFITIFQGV
ncbi:MAG: ComF family protein [Lachnospiraceae bacterium]|nr:ComF family protein [Lachnospiraceae bacterium]